MIFRLRIDPLAQRKMDEFAAYTSAYSEEFAAEQFTRLADALSDIAKPLFDGLTSSSPVRPIEHPSFALAGACNIGSSTPWTKLNTS